MSDMDSRSSCSSDSVAASDLSESAADLETMNHGIFEAQAAMATQAGRMSQFAGGDTTAIHLAHVADMLRVHYVRFNGRSQPGADKFLRESFVAMKRLWMDRSFNGPVVTLTELTTWKFTNDDGGALVVVPGEVLGSFMGFVLDVARDEDACDSVVEAGFDLLDAIGRSRCAELDRKWILARSPSLADEDVSHYGFTAAVLKALTAAAFGENENETSALRASRPATSLRATRTLLTYVKRGSTDPPVEKRANDMLRAGVLERLSRHIYELVTSIEEAAIYGCDEGERRESGASDASYSGKVSIESVGHADGEEHRVRAARVRDRSTSDDQRLHACLALLNGVLRATTVHMDDVCPGSREGVNRVTSELADAAVCLTRDDHCAFALAANSKRKALEAVTAMARYRHPKPGGRDTNIYAIRASCILPMVLNGWRMYIHRCVSAREGDPFHRAYDDEKSRRRSAAERRSSTNVVETFYRDAPAFDDRLTAADVGLALRDAAELFEMDDAETGSAKWFEEVARVRESYEVRNDDGTRALADLAVLAASRGFYSLGSSMHWHATCAHAGAVLHAALFARAEGDALAWAEPGYAQGTPDLLLAAADLEERCRGTVHASSLARRAASILASTSARIRERRVRAATSVTSVTSEKQRPPPVRKRKRRERYRVMETNGKRFYELV